MTPSDGQGPASAGDAQTSQRGSTVGLPPRRPFDRDAVAQGVRLILEGIGDDPDRPGIEGTPERVADMYAELFSGIDRDPLELLTVVRGADHDEMIMVKDIPLQSVCEHHLIPFIGRAHVAYIPNRDGRITGLSKIARVVDLLSKRPQVQERLTKEIADTLETALAPRGVFVLHRGRAPVHDHARREEAGLADAHLVRARHVPDRCPNPGRGPRPRPQAPVLSRPARAG